MPRSILAIAFGLGLATAAQAGVPDRPAPPPATDNAVLRWNAALLEAVRAVRLAPPMTARALAIAHTCMFDAWAAYDHRADGTRFGGTLRRPSRSARWRTRPARSATRRIARSPICSRRRSRASTRRCAISASIRSTARPAQPSPAGIGHTACDGGARRPSRRRRQPARRSERRPAVLRLHRLRAGERSASTSTIRRAGSRCAAPTAGAGVPRAALAPRRPVRAGDGGRVPPAAAGDAGQRRVPAPGRGDPRLQRAAHRPPQGHRGILGGWPATETPPGHWALLASWVSRRDHHGLDDDVVLFFALGNAMLDASIAVWDAKVFYDYVRPMSAVRFRLRRPDDRGVGRSVPGRRASSPASSSVHISPRRRSPSTPRATARSARPRRRCCGCFTGSPRFGATVVVAPGTSTIEPGVTPARPVALSWRTFDDAADEAGLSRRLGGIHFRDGDSGVAGDGQGHRPPRVPRSAAPHCSASRRYHDDPHDASRFDDGGRRARRRGSPCRGRRRPARSTRGAAGDRDPQALRARGGSGAGRTGRRAGAPAAAARHAHVAGITARPLAQRYFDQGMRLAYAFNHAEARPRVPRGGPPRARRWRWPTGARRWSSGRTSTRSWSRTTSRTPRARAEGPVARGHRHAARAGADRRARRALLRHARATATPTIARTPRRCARCTSGSPTTPTSRCSTSSR